VPAWAGNAPEFDAVGDDSANIFAVYNLIQYGQVIAKNVGPLGPINLDSDWTATGNVVCPVVGLHPITGLPVTECKEYFKTSGGQLFPDPCFFDLAQLPDESGNPVPPIFTGYTSALIDAWNEATYEWKIVLQMKPESDLNLNIYDCVTKHNTFDVWGEAEQTGRYRAPWGQLFFTPNQNPVITVEAYPGSFTTPGFTTPFIMDARPLPGLDPPVPLLDAFYTSKALWSEGIIMVMPETGLTNSSGQTMYALKQGDMLKVTVYVNPNPTDIFYGQDNVILKYIGVVGAYYYAPPPPVVDPPIPG
jgi:hypothetical protein